MKLTDTQYNELLSRASAVGPGAIRKVAEMAADDKSEGEIHRTLLDMAIGRTGGTYRNFKDIPDDVLIRGLTQPDIHTID